MRDLKLLHPWLRDRHAELSFEASKAGLEFITTCTLRTPAEHEALWAQGRSDLDTVNQLRALVGWAPITQAQNNEVTWTKRTLHFADAQGFARAFDVALLLGNHQPHWNNKVSVNKNEIADYNELAIIGRKVGLGVGMDWGDAPHYEMPKAVQEMQLQV